MGRYIWKGRWVMKDFVSHPKELSLYSVVPGKLLEGDMLRTELQNNHCGCCVEIRLETE